MLAAQDVAARCKEIGITALHIKLRATGGNRLVLEDIITLKCLPDFQMLSRICIKLVCNQRLGNEGVTNQKSKYTGSNTALCMCFTIKGPNVHEYM